eukprot:1156859-Pelagomonas_calceolata.AAC.9
MIVVIAMGEMEEEESSACAVGSWQEMLWQCRSRSRQSWQQASWQCLCCLIMASRHSTVKAGSLFVPQASDLDYLGICDSVSMREICCHCNHDGIDVPKAACIKGRTPSVVCAI